MPDSTWTLLIVGAIALYVLVLWLRYRNSPGDAGGGFFEGWWLGTSDGEDDLDDDE